MNLYFNLVNTSNWDDPDNWFEDADFLVAHNAVPTSADDCFDLVGQAVTINGGTAVCKSFVGIGSLDFSSEASITGGSWSAPTIFFNMAYCSDCQFLQGDFVAADSSFSNCEFTLHNLGSYTFNYSIIEYCTFTADTEAPAENVVLWLDTCGLLESEFNCTVSLYGITGCGGSIFYGHVTVSNSDPYYGTYHGLVEVDCYSSMVTGATFLPSSTLVLANVSTEAPYPFVTTMLLQPLAGIQGELHLHSWNTTGGVAVKPRIVSFGDPAVSGKATIQPTDIIGAGML